MSGPRLLPSLIGSDEMVEWESTLSKTDTPELWLEYLQYIEVNAIEIAQDVSSLRVLIAAVLERAVRGHPGSYKLWRAYLTRRTLWAQERLGDSGLEKSLLALFERALLRLAEYPRVWLMYLAVRWETLGEVTATRELASRALRSLPPAQHALIWGYLRTHYLSLSELPSETGWRLLKRARLAAAAPAEELRAFGERRGRLEAVARELKSRSDSEEGFLEWCEFVSRHPDVDPDFVSVVRDRVGELSEATRNLVWARLAERHLRRGEFDAAREVYWGALETCKRIEDFSWIFRNYAVFESETVPRRLAEGADGSHLLSKLERFAGRRRGLALKIWLELHPEDIESRRELMSWCLTQRDAEGAKAVLEAGLELRDRLTEEELEDLLESTLLLVEHARATLGSSSLATELLEGALSQRATAKLWRARVELELETTANAKRALTLAKRAVSLVPYSTELFSLWVDLETSALPQAGSLDAVRALVEYGCETKSLTLLHVLTLTRALWSLNYFEETFTLLEKALGVVPAAHQEELWLTYAARLVEHLMGSEGGRSSKDAKHVERIRDVLERACASTPNSLHVWLASTDFEAAHGSARRAMSVFERAAQHFQASPAQETKFRVHLLWAEASRRAFGLSGVRNVLERALSDPSLSSEILAKLALAFARVETSVGETARARAVFEFASETVDPSSDPAALWTQWSRFETLHGNDESFKEMVRRKRVAVARFASVHALDPREEEEEEEEERQVVASADPQELEV